MPNPDVRLLALDGGGVRGLSALMILQQLMEAIDLDAPPKPCDYFDMIGGTSTGGLIAIMLGRLKMSIGECIDAYLQLSDRIFQKKRHRATVKGKIQGRFDSDELERAVKEVIKEQGLQEDALLKDTPDASCKVFVCATSIETGETVCLTSYKSPRGNNDLLSSVKIWEACRATSAASSFFDPIAIGRYNEEFVDGATGANNPVVELWNQAQLMWGPDPLEGKVQCLVSIGTGIPSLKPFRNDLLHIGETLVAIATETEQTAERFRRDKAYLDGSNRYFRFNVVRGLEDIGLEKSTKRKEIAAATRRYIASQDVFKQMQACAGNLASREYVGEYRTNFSLEGVPRAKTFVERPSEMAELERALLPQRQNMRQKIFVLYGLGGIGKTQLAVEFARRHHRKFSSVFWLDGSSEVNLKLSIARCAGRIPASQISDASRTYSMSSAGNIDDVVREVMGWLAQPDNTEWLVVFDNVDRDYSPHTVDPLAYDVRQYFSGADHGSLLITTRLARLEQLGGSQQVIKVDRAQAQEILESWYSKELVESGRLYSLLDGLPLAIAQAGAYLQQSGVGLGTYLRFYEQQWEELMQTRDQVDTPLQDYPDRSVWTTWTISFNVIREQDKATSNLLLLWSFLDNKDLGFRLFTAACSASREVAAEVSRWIGDLANSELKFTQSMQLLRSYSLVESVENGASYATHPVVHRWARYYCSEDYSDELARLALVVVGWAVPSRSTRDRLYKIQGKLDEAEKMCMRALQAFEEVLGPKHTSTLAAVDNLGDLYNIQGKLVEAEKMHMRALQGYEEALGPKHISTLRTVYNMGNLYRNQGKLGEAEKMYMRALQGREEALGPKHTSTLDTVNNLGVLYKNQGKLGEAEKMYMQALQGYEEALGPKHTSTLSTVNNLGNLYKNQGKLGEAEKICAKE
ncbi:hypothetical protein DL768_007291 [Monosporascus sp. mg162]|nr:hypothetical protein DL768_007291 [Monosporascus sp. mg162]